MTLNKDNIIYSETMGHVQRLNSLNKLGQALTASLDLDVVLAQVLDEVSHLLEAEGVAVLLLDEDELVFRAVSGPGAEGLQGFRMPANKGIAGRVFSSGEPQLVTGPDGREQQYQEAEEASQYQTQDLLAVPLQLDGKVVGVLEAAHSELGTFTANDLAILQDIATWVNVAIRNAQLYQSAQQEISERRQVEKALRKSERELEKRVAERTIELENAYNRLQEQDALKTKFIDDISHEMRTPVANMSLYLDLSQKRRDNPEKLEYYLSVIKLQNQRLTELVDQFIEFSRLERDFNTLPFDWVSLNDIVQEVFDSLKELATAANLKINCQLETPLSEIWGSDKHLNSAVRNLMLNAIKYTPEGSVRVATYPTLENKVVTLEITDTGIGISPTEMVHVRERFYRSPRVSQLTVPGAGLGLALAQEIVLKHNGELEIKSEEDVGTSVFLHLPTTTDSQESETAK